MSAVIALWVLSMLACAATIWRLSGELKDALNALDEQTENLRSVRAQLERLRAAIAPPTKRPPKKITARKPKRAVE